MRWWPPSAGRGCTWNNRLSPRRDRRARVFTTLLPLLAFALLTAANAGFVAAEFALVTVDRAEIDQQASSGDRTARTVRLALRELSFQLSGAQLVITISALLA